MLNNQNYQDNMKIESVVTDHTFIPSLLQLFILFVFINPKSLKISPNIRLFYSH